MNNKELENLFDELVPHEGKADCVAGELVRAYSRVSYRFFNDGDIAGQGYGNETCNAAVRYLKQYGDETVKHLADQLFGCCFDREYEELLEEIADALVKMIEGHPELREQETIDMWDLFDEELDCDDSCDDEEEDDYDDYEEDDE